MTSALEAQGIAIKRGDGSSPESFTTIAEITDFDGPSGSASEIDVSSFDSTAKEFLIGLKDEGQFTFSCNLVPDDTSQSGLRDDRDNRDLRNFQITLTDSPATTLDFAAYVMSFATSGSVDAAITASITLRISGAVTWS